MQVRRIKARSIFFCLVGKKGRLLLPHGNPLPPTLTTALRPPRFTESERPRRWVHTCLHSFIQTCAAAAAEPNPLTGRQPLQSAQSLATSDLMSALTRIKVKRQKWSPTSSARLVLAAPAGGGGGRVGETCWALDSLLSKWGSRCQKTRSWKKGKMCRNENGKVEITAKWVKV